MRGNRSEPFTVTSVNFQPLHEDAFLDEFPDSIAIDDSVGFLYTLLCKGPLSVTLIKYKYNINEK